MSAVEVGDECRLALGAGRCARLEECDLSGCVRCCDSGVRALVEGCPNLQGLFLMGLAGVSDVGVRCVARSCRRLTSISLMGCSGISDEGVVWLSRVGTLRLLNLGGCGRVGSIGVQSLAQTGSMLQSLDLSNCNAPSKPRPSNWCVTAATSLDLSNCTAVEDDALQLVCDHLLHALNVQGIPPGWCWLYDGMGGKGGTGIISGGTATSLGGGCDEPGPALGARAPTGGDISE